MWRRQGRDSGEMPDHSELVKSCWKLPSSSAVRCNAGMWKPLGCGEARVESAREDYDDEDRDTEDDGGVGREDVAG